MRKNTAYLLLAAATFFMTGCTPDDSDSIGRADHPLFIHTMVSTPSVVPAYSPSRAGDYAVTTPEDSTQLHLYLPNNDDTKQQHDKEYIFAYNATAEQWACAKARVQKNVVYDVFGFVPEAGVTSSAITYNSDETPSDAGTPTTLTLNGIQAANAYDVCFIVGVSSTGEPTIGDFSYTGKEKDNNLYLKLDHLFAEIQFKFRINADYGALRKVRINEVTLKTESISTVNAAITLTPGTGATNIAWTTNSGDGSSATLFSTDDGDTPILLTTSYQSIPGYLCPLAAGEDMGYSIEVKYDVFLASCSDAAILSGTATPIRSEQTATNHWKNNTAFHVERGTKYTVSCTVNPTYLYQLDDDDLGDPVFNFGS